MLEVSVAAETALESQAVLAQVERIVQSQVFRQSQRQCRFLRYIVEQSMIGATARLKGYSIGLEVFDRQTDFDPSADSIVRVEAGRLRAKLRDYYQDEGCDDPIFIDLPKGTYVPSIKGAIPRPAGRADDARRELRAVPDNSIAILPFRNLSADPEQEYFSDGMTDAIITAAAGIKALHVISLTSVMRHKSPDRRVPDVADDLGVRYVMEGTVLKEGKHVRVTAQLVDGRTDRHLWAESFERELSSIMRVQYELAQKIALSLAAEISQIEPAAQAVQIDPEAYESYLLGRRYRSRLTREGFNKATECFRKAIDIAPGFGAAYAALASCYCALGSYGFELERPDLIIPRGLEYSHKAADLDPNQVDAHSYTAIMTLKYAWDWPAAEAEFRRALEISPSDTRSHLQYSLFFETLGEHERAIQEAEQARRMDPLSTETNINLAWQLHQAGRNSEALARLDWTGDLNPEFWGLHWGYGHAWLALDEIDRALDSFRKSADSKGANAIPLQRLGYALAVAGDRAGARDVLAQLDSLSKKGYVSPYYYAAIHAGLGDDKACFAALEQAYAVRARSLAWIRVAKEFRAWRRDPRFLDLMSRIGIPESYAALHEWRAGVRA